MTGWGRTTLGPEPLAAVVRTAYDVELVALELVDGGADSSARTWRGTDPAGVRWAVREAVGGSPAGPQVASAPTTSGRGRSTWCVRTCGRRILALAERTFAAAP